jgi:hypothetical protein
VVQLEEELCCEFKKTRITEDSEKLCQEGIERVYSGTVEHRRRYSARRASRRCADRHKEN